MRKIFYLLLLLLINSVSIYAQDDPLTTLTIGDSAPSLRLRTWLKGTPVQKFEKGKVYVVEFWATWCKPCIASMPHLSVLANKYKDHVTVIGIDIYERKTTSIERVKAFVDSMGNHMDYRVAAEESNFMETAWLNASGEQVSGIPRTFVVNAEGRLAWIGHPKDLEKVLPKIVDNAWDIKEALANRNLNRYLEELDDSAQEVLNGYTGNPFIPGNFRKPDSMLIVINQIVAKEPRLKYAPFIAHHTFYSLLLTDIPRALQYGKKVLVTPTYDEPAYDAVIDGIKWFSDNYHVLPSEFYELGAEAYQEKIDLFPYPEAFDFFRYYNKMEEWYWLANNKSKAIEAGQKAIEELKKK